MIRTLLRREVNASGSISMNDWPAPFDLRWAAWGAAVETLQIDIVASGWMNLFAALLMPHPETELRWSGAGPGTNAEIKRAYSALMGRFFGRATLRRDHGCRWLRQVVDGLELAPGVHLRRRVGHDGDLPDWVGWDDNNGCWVVAEAKGSHDRGNWLTVNPPPLRRALAQLDRVEIVDASGPISFKTWAVACRWGTQDNMLPPAIITCDPDGRGRPLNDLEVPKFKEESRARWIADLLDGLGRPEIAASVKAGEVYGADATQDDLVVLPGRSGYGALAIEAGGLIPLVGPRKAERSRAIVETARLLKRGTALILLDRAATESAIARVGIADEFEDGRPDPRSVTDMNAATRDTPTEITVDGVTFRTETDDIGFLGMETDA